MRRDCVRRTGRVARVSWLFKLAVVSVLLGAWPRSLSAQVPPDEAWRTLDTEHFRVTFPERLEALGRRAADRAERAYGELTVALAEPPRGTIDLLITDHQDVSNGFAQVNPSNRITVFARPPVDDLSLGYFDDWMELVITHELTHIVHLDRTEIGIGKLLRGVFGRVTAPWPFFPGVGTPRWVTEGIATWYESRLTNSGRVRGTFNEMVLRTAALEGRFEGVGPASGESPQWPSGTRAYAYGSLFFDYLLQKHGEGRMSAFVDAVAGQWVPYRLDAAGERAFGETVSHAWREWADRGIAEAQALDGRISALAPITEPERLTHGARWAMNPAVSPDGTRVVYARADGKSDSQLTEAAPDGSGSRSLSRTNGLVTFDWMPDGDLLVSQNEFNDRYRVFADLYVVTPDGSQRRLTHGARIEQPSVVPGGARAVGVLQGDGATGLASVNLVTGEVTELVAPETDVLWSFPRVSPNGRWIAASRWSPEAFTDIVILDARGTLVTEVTRDRALDVAPAWSPDGRWVVWGSDRTGIPNILAAPVDPETAEAGAPRLVTNVRTGAAYPSVDPSASWVYFSGYHVDGWELERARFDPESAPLAPPVSGRFAEASPPPTRGSAAGEVRKYSPWSTLAPRYWEPLYRDPVRTRAIRTSDLFLRGRQLLGAAVGAQTSGIDLVGRHSYGAFARVFTTGGKWEGGASYRYAGLGNPTLALTARQFWDEDGPRVTRRDDAAPLDTLFVLERDRSLSASVTFSRPRWRDRFDLTLSGGVVWEHQELLDNALGLTSQYRLSRPESRLSDFSVSAFFSTARSHPLQMGGDRGASLFARARTRNELSLPDSLVGSAGSDRSVDDVIGRIRVYLPLSLPGYSSHVIALRASGGAARGPNAGAGFFDVGGASGSGETVTGLDLFGGGALFFPVRGYDESTRFGRYAWSATAEYRIPLSLVNRGLGAWPIHFDRLLASVFLDAGNAWGPDVTVNGFINPRRATLVSVGAEFTTEVLTFYKVDMRFRTGVAAPLVERRGTRVYLRLGLPF
jgi:WD40-like Beta Propeller Repeat